MIAGFRTLSESTPSHLGRNPRAGERIAIAAPAAPSFKAGKTLRDVIE